MSADSRARWAGLAVLAACAGCAGTSVPKGWLPAPREAQESAYGGWIEVSYRDGDARQRAVGELIAVGEDSVWILSDSQAVAIPTTAADSGRLWVYAPQTSGLAAWTAAGVLSTISNGIVLVFTAPMWILGGTIAGGHEVRAAQRRGPPLSWAELARYARFPQGLPEGIRVADLRAKPSAPRPVPTGSR
jgi:hypothetical protein